MKSIIVTLLLVSCLVHLSLCGKYRSRESEYFNANLRDRFPFFVCERLNFIHTRLMLQYFFIQDDTDPNDDDIQIQIQTLEDLLKGFNWEFSFDNANTNNAAIQTLDDSEVSNASDDGNYFALI